MHRCRRRQRIYTTDFKVHTDMKNIRLKSLAINNWRAQNRKIVLTDRTVISGRNKSGKSTTKDALLWLLTGYDSDDRFNFRLFDTTVEQTYENSLAASVEGVFDIDGMDYTLKKTARPGWSRKRGGDTYEKKATDDYSFQIDGVEVSSGDYSRFVETNFCRMDFLKFVLNILYYRTRDWREMRKTLAEVIGEVQESDFTGDYHDLKPLLDKYGTLDVIREMLKKQRNPIKELIGDKSSKGALQSEIDALMSSLPDVSDIKEAEEKERNIRAEIEEIDNMIVGASDSVRPLIEERNRQLKAISERKSELETLRIKYNAAAYAEEKRIMDAISDAERENGQARKRQEQADKNRASVEIQIADTENEIKRLREYRNELLERNKEVKSRKFSNDKCSYCGQTLPQDMLEIARAKFNECKEIDHDRIVSEGKRNNERIKSLEVRISELKESLARDNAERQSSEYKDIDALRAGLAEIRDGRKPFEDSPEYRKAMSEIAQMESELVDVTPPDTSELSAKKAELTKGLMECAGAKSRKSEYDRMKAEIRKRQDDLSANATELARIEGLLAKCEEMEKEKAEIIRKKVSVLFDVCEISMETRKKDGTTQPACDISVGGIPVSVLNTAEITLAGIDLSNAFCKHIGTWMPLIVDNAESVDEERIENKYGRQIIILKRDDCELNVNNE